MFTHCAEIENIRGYEAELQTLRKELKSKTDDLHSSVSSPDSNGDL